MIVIDTDTLPLNFLFQKTMNVYCFSQLTHFIVSYIVALFIDRNTRKNAKLLKVKSEKVWNHPEEEFQCLRSNRLNIKKQ